VTATDLVLTVTELMRKTNVVNKFVEFFGEGVASLTVPDRATIATWHPTTVRPMGFFRWTTPPSSTSKAPAATKEETTRSSPTSRPRAVRRLRKGEIDYSQVVELDSPA